MGALCPHQHNSAVSSLKACPTPASHALRELKNCIHAGRHRTTLNGSGLRRVRKQSGTDAYTSGKSSLFTWRLRTGTVAAHRRQWGLRNARFADKLTQTTPPLRLPIWLIDADISDTMESDFSTLQGLKRLQKFYQLKALLLAERNPQHTLVMINHGRQICEAPIMIEAAFRASEEAA